MSMSSVRAVICVVFLTLFTLLFGSIWQDQYCNNAYECVGTQWILSSNNTYHAYERFYHRGYKSLSGLNTSVTTVGGVNCYGAFACAQVSFILSGGISGVDCDGTHSCANIAGSSYIKAQSDIYCNGANACENSNITSNNRIFCWGDQSCIHSNITSPTVSAPGAYSLYGATIYISTAVYLEGHQTGFGSTIKCTSG
eukprot:279738_1